ncbi:hypothetical protein GGP41_010072 [Bipolaris sorokiniana]|uniref:Uncharacterized protein n=1 Tax=Cochliobolus sativus TaxID=45130 RepID=A0A8H5ZGX2_COCSA|nr:hypothetical protein GGP41_010072 [Bipolaris sorokiniana]
MANASHWASMLFAASGWRVVGGGTLHLHLLSRSLTMQQRQGEEAKGRDATMQASKKKALISRLQRQTHPPPLSSHCARPTTYTGTYAYVEQAKSKVDRAIETAFALTCRLPMVAVNAKGLRGAVSARDVVPQPLGFAYGAGRSLTNTRLPAAASDLTTAGLRHRPQTF